MRRTTTLLTVTGSLLNAAGELTGCVGEPAPGESPDADRPCTADIAQRVTLVGVPEGVDPAQATRVDVTFGNASGSIELPGAEWIAGMVYHKLRELDPKPAAIIEA